MKQLPIKTKKQRLLVYKQALNNPKWFEGQGLCFVLQWIANGKPGNPKELWLTINKWQDACIMFPEFSKFYDPNMCKALKYVKLWETCTKNEWRIKVLNRCIELCNKP